MVVAAGLHAITARAHVAPASAVVTALVDEQPSTILGAALANSPEPIASEQPCRAVQDREENLLQTVGDTGPLCTRSRLAVATHRAGGGGARTISFVLLPVPCL